MALEYRDFYYPLNVFMHVLTLEEGRVAALHYGLFDRDDDSIELAQRRSTELLLSRLPAPPATILEVGIGLGDTLAELTRLGYAATGITPDDKQIAVARERHGDAIRVHAERLESFQSDTQFDVVVFQESSQYIESRALWDRMVRLARNRVVVLDEFSISEGGTLHSLAGFLDEATAHGFRVLEERDLTSQAAPTIDYFSKRFPAYRQRLIDDLGLTSEQIDELIAGGVSYRAHYDRGVYAYRLLVIEREAARS